MNKSKHAIMLVLQFLLVKGKKHYLVVSIDSLQNLLEKYHGVLIERRWLFYCLAHLQSAGYLKRKGRWWMEENNLIRRKPSMITFTLAGAQYLKQKLVRGSEELYRRIYDWLAKKKKQWPQVFDVCPGQTGADAAEALRAIGKIIKDIG